MEVSCSSQLYPIIQYTIELVKEKEPTPFQIRSLAAVVAARAVCQLHPKAKIQFQSAIEGGFVVGFHLNISPTDSLLPQIEEVVRNIVQQNEEITWMTMESKNAAGMFKDQGQPLLADVVASSTEGTISVARLGDWSFPCIKAPIDKAKNLGAVQLLTFSVKPSAEKKGGFLVRLFGTAFVDKKELKSFEKAWRECQKVDHRKVGLEQKLFVFNDEGDIFWLSRGLGFCEYLSNLWKKQAQKRGFQTVTTSIGEDLLRDSLHVSHDALYSAEGGNIRRYSEVGPIWQNVPEEKRWGAFRTEEATVAGSTIFCPPSQVKNELISSLQMILEISRIFDFKCKWTLSRRNSVEKRKNKGRLGLDHLLLEALEETGILLGESEERACVAKLQAVDSLNRSWTIGEIEVVAAQKQVVQIRQSFGSFERLGALLIEHCRGVWPKKLAPLQVFVLSAGEGAVAFAHEVAKRLIAIGVRSEVDDTKDEIRMKMKRAEKSSAPFVVTAGQDKLVKVDKKRMNIEDLLTYVVDELERN